MYYLKDFNEYNFFHNQIISLPVNYIHACFADTTVNELGIFSVWTRVNEIIFFW